MSETLLVVGGAGFIGSNFARAALADTNLRVVVADKLTYAGSLENLSELQGDRRFAFEKLDICDRPAVDKLFNDYAPKWVINFAAETHVDRSIDGPRAFVTTNVLGAFELLDASYRFWTSLPIAARASFRFLQVSTDEVFGSLGPSGAFSESTTYSPNSPYAASKAGADHLVRAYRETFGLPVLLTNCSNNYGPFQFPEKLLPLMITNAVEGRPLPIYGDGSNVRDWLHVEDHCAALLKVLDRGRPGEKYNVGGRGECTNLEIINMLCEVLDEVVPISQNPALHRRGLKSYAELKTFVPDRPGHDRRYAIDATKIRSELGWEPKRSLQEGLKHTVNWYLANARWCELVRAGQYQGQRLGLSTVGAPA